jgi:uncharacterized protein (TIGR03083 family)
MRPDEKREAMTTSPEEQATAYAGVRARVREVLVESDRETRVPSCPDWSVADLCAHLAGVAVALVNRDRPGADVQAWIDGHVSDRVGRSIESLLDEWDGSGFEDLIRARPEGYGGLLYDVAAHEHDLRGALGRPGGRSSDAISACLDIQQLMLGRDMATKGVVGSVDLVAGAHRLSAVNGEGPSLRLELHGPDSAWELFRLVGSRRTVEQIRALPWSGDVDAFLPAFEHLPFPSTALVE